MSMIINFASINHVLHNAVISTLSTFAQLFRRAHQENCKEAELQKKKAQKEAELEKSKSSKTIK